MNKWISVKDRMPEDDLPQDSNRVQITVLICTQGKFVSIASRMFDNNGKWIWSKWKHGVTHWMYLPKPPKEEENET